MSDEQENLYSELVPEKSFRELLNEEGEIQVGDTIYCIARQGTFYAHREDISELRRVVKSYRNQSVERPDYIQIGKVTLFNTFGNIKFEEEDSIQYEKSISFRNLGDRYQGLDWEKFPEERASRKTWAGKLLQSIGFRKSLTSVFPNHSKRRLNCAVFDYNYIIRESLGVTAKIEKKMWHGGWGKIQNIGAGDIVVGCRRALVKISYPEAINVSDIFPKDIKKMKDDDYIRTIPTPKWMQRRLVNVTLPLLFGKDGLTLSEAIVFAADRVKSVMRSYGQFALSNNFHSNYMQFSQADIDRKVKELKFEEYVPVTIPIYAKDAIYLYIVNAFRVNDRDNAETTLRFHEAYTSWKVGITYNLSGKQEIEWKHILDGKLDINQMKPHINVIGIDNGLMKLELAEPSERSVQLMEGEFFAAGSFEGVWTGFRLYW